LVNTPLRALRNWWLGSALGRSIRVLSPSDQKKLLTVTLIQISLAGLDLLGVLAIGLLGTLAVIGPQPQTPNNQVSSAIELLSISSYTFQTQVSIIGIGAVFLLLGRTVLSIFFTRRVIFFMSRRGANISAELISRLLSQSLLKVQRRNSQEILFAVTTGVEIVTLQILAVTVVLISDVSLLLVMVIGLFVFDPMTALGTFLTFAFIGVALYRLMHIRASKLGTANTWMSIKSSERVLEVFASYRESVVRNRRHYYAREIGKLRFNLADNAAEMSFMPYISKYVIETSVVLGAVLIGAIQFVMQDATQAVATLAVFLAAGSRIAPAVLRLQQGSITIRGALGKAKPTLDLVDELGDTPIVEDKRDDLELIHEGFNSEIHVRNVSLTYPGKVQPALSNITLIIPPGASVAIVGPSGAGKTTMIDVLLGVLNPDEGSVLISDLPPLLTVSKWPGAVSYVPQDVVIAPGTIRENVALGYPLEAATDELVMSALAVAQLDRFVADLPLGIDTQAGERGAKISGGQRQRLGIARAMFTRPRLLVLDEATSSLDGETEASVTEAIQALRGSITVVMIAHRLSTVRNADLVVYLSNGRVLATGTFNEVREAVPDFDRQAKLMGL
jgi:ABC-type multidrug transport system fused ATPase/permease subunit